MIERCLARRPPHDRDVSPIHPKRPPPKAAALTKDQALRRPHHAIGRERRRPLSARAHRHFALRYRGGIDARTRRPTRQCRVTYNPFADDFVARKGEDAVDRKALIHALKDFMKANDLKADWRTSTRPPNEALVNALSMMSPYGPAEKQALLEAPDLKTGAETAVAITEIETRQEEHRGRAAVCSSFRAIRQRLSRSP